MSKEINSNNDTTEKNTDKENNLNDNQMADLISKYLKTDKDDSSQAENNNIVSDKPIEQIEIKDDTPFEQNNQDDILNDIIKNTNKSVDFEEHTTRRSKYQGEESFIDVENPFQSSKKDETEREVVPQTAEVQQPKKQLKTFNQMFKDISAKIFPHKGDKKSEFVRKIIMDVSVVTLVGCAIAFGVIGVQSNKAEKSQSGLASQIVDITSDEEEKKMWEDFYAKYPNITLPKGMMAKYAYLYALNQQLAGWISVPNSGIDVQVVQSANNTDYLKKDFYGNYSRYGCPFLDYRNDAKYLNQNSIIYGHHMSDGLVFAELSKYKELNGFLESPIIQFDTLYKSYKFKVYAAFITNSKAEDDNGYIFNYTVTSFDSTSNFDDFIKALDERKLYTTGVDINSGDKLITLSTCTYEFTDARLVIVGRMLRNGETTDIDTTYATTNGNPRYPQVWYDQKGRTNPFANASRWYPAS